jgi:hypothetical protein
MSKPTKLSKCFTMDPGVLSYLVKTSEGRSLSGRLNELLQRAILEEQYAQLEQEAEEFFSGTRKRSRKESRAFQKASARSVARE